MKRTIFGTFLAFGFFFGSITGSSAADMAIAKPYTPPPPFSWAGPYVVGTIGGGMAGRSLVDDNEGVAYGSHDISDWVFNAGLGIGYNWQHGSFVHGFEADISWISFDESHYVSSWDVTHRAQWDWFATVRYRAGLAFDRTLIYATAGVAFVSLDYKSTYTGETCSSDNAACLDTTQAGFTGGVGLEYAFAPNWNFRFEYLGIYLPSKHVTDLSDSFYTYSFSSWAHLARLGLVYRW